MKECANRMRDTLHVLGISPSIDAVIAGSAVMQAVLNEAWEGADVDMWASAPALPSIQADLTRAGYALTRHVLIDEHSAYARMSAIIACIHEFAAAGPERPNQERQERPNPNQKPLIQVITVKGSPVAAVHTFDITACQVYYVPREHAVVAASPEALDALLARTLVFSQSSLETQTPVEWIRTLKRVCKYLRRGFVIDDAQWNLMLESLSFSSDSSTSSPRQQWVQSANRHGQGARVRFEHTPGNGFKVSKLLDAVDAVDA
jgi:hypothetical protein